MQEAVIYTVMYSDLPIYAGLRTVASLRSSTRREKRYFEFKKACMDRWANFTRARRILFISRSY